MRDEAAEVIASTKIAVLATINEDGSPHATPITYSYVGGQFIWQSAADAVHSLNIERDGRVSLSIVERTDGSARGVYVNSFATPTGAESFNETWQKSLADYTVALGELDETRSTPGRFYFKGTNA